MGEIYKCDKCGKIIKDDEREIRFSIFGRELLDKHGFPDMFLRSFYLCEKCSEPFIKYVKRFLKIKKNKKIDK